MSILEGVIMSDFWKNKRVIVTGGAGFLGRPLVRRLCDRGATVFVPRSATYDLRYRFDIVRMLDNFPDPDIVFHLAATVGGIGFSRRYPGQQIYDGLAMGINVVEMCRLYNVGKLVFAGSVCAYPKFTSVPFQESSLWDGYPEETNAAYGISKRAIISLLQAYHQEYGMESAVLLPTNMYGPRDNFDPESSHVIPALIRKAIEARENGIPLTVWGTGSASRDFLYVRDAADAFVAAGELVNVPDPINIGSGQEVSIASLVDLVSSIVGFDGPIEWDKSKPDGQPRRRLDTSMAARNLDWEAQTSLYDGIVETVEWYNATRKH